MELKGPGFTLRGWRHDDAAALQKHADNPNVYSFLMERFPHPYTMEAATNWIAAMLKQDPLITFVIAIDDQLIGVTGLEMRDDVYRKAPLLGYWLAEEYWGRGIAAEAVKLLVNYAFATLDIVRIQAGVLSNNPRSARVLEKADFVKEGVLRDNVFKNGVVLDEWIYGVVK
jgi:[ribosomal protein S5]-alanine N-acetyltransferase